jgi:hypothetical protein
MLGEELGGAGIEPRRGQNDLFDLRRERGRMNADCTALCTAPNYAEKEKVDSTGWRPPAS